MKQLTNDILSISVDEHGAELASIRKGEREYLWQAYPEFWKRHSPILFPIVGSVWNGEFRSHGKTWKMSQHGFARDSDFTLKSESNDRLEFVFESNESTLERYPYPFRLTISYELRAYLINIVWKVENIGNEEMSFQIGAHPAFYWPLFTDKEIEEGVEAMNKRLAEGADRGFFRFTPKKDEIISSVIEKAGCVSTTKENHFPLTDSYLKLDKDTFTEIDTLILENNQFDAVTLCDEQKKPYITLKFGHPLVGLWSPPGKNAPFVCIEPWYGRADFVDYEGTYEDRKWMNHLEPGKTFEASYQIVIE